MGAFVHHIPFVRRGGGGGGGGGVFKKLHRAVFYGDRSKLFWMSLYKLITVYTRAISQAKNNNYTVVWLGLRRAEPPYVIIGWGGGGGGLETPQPPLPPLLRPSRSPYLPRHTSWVWDSGARHKLTFHASMHAIIIFGMILLLFIICRDFYYQLSFRI